MPVLTRVRSMFRSVLGKASLDADLDQELASHLELLAEEKVRQGHAPADALRMARIELGGLEQVKQRVRERRVGAGIDTLLLDLRFALRTIRRAPAHTGIVVLILAIGIGAATALFGTINAVLLRAIPFENPDTLVVGLKTRNGRIGGPVSRPDYYDYRDRARAFEEFASMGNFAFENAVMGGDRPELLKVGFATWNLFRTLGVPPAAGRLFLPQDEEVGGSTVVLISHRLWLARFGGSSAAVGSTLAFDGTLSAIVGVLPRGFRFLHDIDVWGLIDRQGPIDQARDSHSLIVVGRLRPGTSIEQAQSDVDGIAAALAREFPATNDDKGLWLGDLHGYMVRGVRSSLTLLMATSALVLLIACGNAAGLVLARGQRRLPEMAMRSALGARRKRLIRQLVSESLVVSALAGSAGIGVAFLLQRLLLRLLPIGAIGIDPPTLDATALVFALLVSIATGLLVGVVPARRSTVVAPSLQIVAGARGSEGVRSTRLRSGLVITQVAMSVLLLIASALLVRSLGRLASVDLGFDHDDLFTARVQIQPGDYPTLEARSQFFASLIERIDAMPGVISATAISKLPILNRWQDWPIWLADQPRPLPSQTRLAMARWVTPDYFRTVGIPLLEGRDVAASDRPGAARVVVLSESVARAFFPERGAVGQHVKIGWDDEPWEVIGIVGEARLNRLSDEPNGAMYMPAAQAGATRLGLAVRTSGDPMALAAPIREAVRRLDGNAVVSADATMASIVDGELASHRIVILSLGLFSAIALLLTAIGLYGILAYHVGQRTREIGIRLALGAEPARVVWRFVIRGLGLVAGGMALGLLGAIPASRLLRDLLFEIEPSDPVSFAGAFAVLAVLGGLACLLPALRATKVDPAQTLRAE